MGRQIVLTSDPFGNTNIFGNPDVSEFCLNATQIIQQKQAFESVAYQLGIACLIIGFMIGSVSVYLYFWRQEQNGSSE